MWYNRGMSDNTLTPVPVRVTDDALASTRSDWTGHWAALSAACLADGGVWYTLPDVPYKYASAIRTGRIRVFTPVDAWEVKVHEKQLYVRYVGSEVDDDS